MDVEELECRCKIRNSHDTHVVVVEELKFAYFNAKVYGIIYL